MPDGKAGPATSNVVSLVDRQVLLREQDLAAPRWADKIKGTVRLVYVSLCTCAVRDGWWYVEPPSPEEIADVCGISARLVRRSLRRLSRLGLVLTCVGYDAKDTATSYLYVVFATTRPYESAMAPNLKVFLATRGSDVARYVVCDADNAGVERPDKIPTSPQGRVGISRPGKLGPSGKPGGVVLPFVAPGGAPRALPEGVTPRHVGAAYRIASGRDDLMPEHLGDWMGYLSLDALTDAAWAVKQRVDAGDVRYPRAYFLAVLQNKAHELGWRKDGPGRSR